MLGNPRVVEKFTAFRDCMVEALEGMSEYELACVWVKRQSRPKHIDVRELYYGSIILT